MNQKMLTVSRPQTWVEQLHEAGTLSDALGTIFVNDACERANLAQEFSKKGIAYRGIILKDIFFELMNQVNPTRDFFHFNQIYDGNLVFADTRTLHQSSVLSSLKRFISETNEYSEENFPNIITAKNVRLFGSIIQNVDRESKNILWPTRSDADFEPGVKRKIPISFTKPPKETTERLNQCKKSEYTVSWVMHRNAFFLDSTTEEVSWEEDGFIKSDLRIRSAFSHYQRDFLSNSLRFFLESNQEKIKGFLDTDTFCFSKLNPTLKREFQLQQKRLNTMSKKVQSLGLAQKFDPIAFVDRGKWIVIIDHYGKFPYENELLKLAKDYYVPIRLSLLNN